MSLKSEAKEPPVALIGTNGVNDFQVRDISGSQRNPSKELRLLTHETPHPKYRLRSCERFPLSSVHGTADHSEPVLPGWGFRYPMGTPFPLSFISQVCQATSVTGENVTPSQMVITERI